MEKKQKMKGDEIDVIGLLEKVWNKRYFLFKFCLVVLSLGIVVVFSIPKKYCAEVKIVLENTKNVGINKVNSFASLMGLGGSNEINTEISIDIYPEIIKSTPYLIDFAKIRVEPEGLHEMSFFEYLVRFQKNAWWNSVMRLPQTIVELFSKKEEWHNDTIWDSFKLTRQQRQFINDLITNIQVKTEQETGLLSIKVFMQDPVVAAIITENVVNRLYDYIEVYQSQKITQEIGFVEDMFSESRKNYEQTQLRFEEYRKSDKQGNKAIGTQVDIDLAFGLYNMMSQQYDIAKVKLMKKSPAFSVIEPATVPLNADSPRKSLILLLSLGLGLFVGVLWIFIKDAFSR